MREILFSRKKLKSFFASFSLSNVLGILGIFSFLCDFLVNPARLVDPWMIIVAVFTVVALFFVSNFSLQIWLTYLVFFFLLTLHPDLRIMPFVLTAPILAVVVTYKDHLVSASIGSVFLWYCGSITPEENRWLPHNFMAALMWGLMLFVAVLVGHALHKGAETQEEIKRKWEQDIRTHRESLARALHDSVATSLTSVIMQAETLRLSSDLPPNDRQKLDLIVDQARISMKEIRELLKMLSSNSSSHDGRGELPLSEQIHQTSMRLSAHGFTVQQTGSVSHILFSDEELGALREIFTEITANIFKYAQPSSMVTISIDEKDTELNIGFFNIISGRSTGEDLSTGLGNSIITQLAKQIGGEISFISDSTTWETVLRLDLTTQHRL